MNATREEWRPVVGYEGLYEVSDRGRVRSLDRIVKRPAGEYLKRGRMMQLNPITGRRYLSVTLTRADKRATTYVHRMVLEAFVGAAPPESVACHYDDDVTNNNVSNLRWDTQVGNGLDTTRNGHNHHANKDACVHGHEFTEENTRTYGNGWRRCRQCVRDEYVRNGRTRRGKGANE